MSDEKSDNFDLVMPLPENIERSQRPPTGNGIVLEVDGILHRYHYDLDLFLGKRMSERLRAEQGWFEKLVAHAPSVGTFYEDALRAIIRDLLPTQMEVATGFVFDADNKVHSKQIDIVTYDPTKRSPEYRRGGFVVISPEIGVSYSEVKKTLKLSDAREVIKAVFSFNLGSHAAGPPSSNRICIFSYSGASKTERLFQVVFDTLCAEVKSFEWKTKGGHKVAFSPRNIVLPSFYFFDRQDFIECRLVPDQGAATFSIDVTQCQAASDNSLNEYLSEMVDLAQQGRDLWKRDFRTLALRNYSRSERIAANLHLAQVVPMIKIADLFPKERMDISRFRVRGRRPYEARISSTIDLATIKTFAQLACVQGIHWECID